MNPEEEKQDSVTFTPPAIPDPYFPAPVIPPAESPLMVIDLSKVTPGENGEITITYIISGKLT